MISFLRYIKAALTEQYYWYEVRFIYKDKSGLRILDFTTEIGLKRKYYVLDHRLIKKTLEPLHQLDIPKRYLKNGIIAIDIIGFLGRFPKVETKIKV